MVSAAVVGGGVYLYTQKDVLIERARERATEAITEAVTGAAIGGALTGGLGGGGGITYTFFPCWSWCSSTFLNSKKAGKGMSIARPTEP